MNERLTDAESLKYQLKMAGYSLAEVAEKVGVSRSLVSKVLHRSRRSKEVQKFIARQLDTPVDELFGPIQENMEVSDE
ncbi:MAG: helix-turn-helix transcriptional regulator [Roseobacter sp.]|jgi:transcriptional regulator with XRE-family HTH domain|uniref:helix-turn-helix transcriptional regulator n=1 Tax=Ascidiaceihabitans sp. TaxID=1872644 RepID=UPI003269D4B2